MKKFKSIISVLLTLALLVSVAAIAPATADAATYVSVVKSKRYAYYANDGTWVDYTVSQPKFNFNTYDASVVNQKLAAVFTSQFDSSYYYMTNRIQMYHTYDYYTYTSNGIVTIITKQTAPDCAAAYDIYNFRISDGKRVYNSDLCKAFGAKTGDCSRLAADLENREYNARWKHVSKSEWNLTKRAQTYYVGANGRLNVAYGYMYVQKLGTIYANAPSPSVNATNSGAEIKWSKINGIPKFRVYKKVSGSWKKLGDTTSTKYTDKSAKPGGTYTYTVRGINSSGSIFMTGYKSSGVSVKFVSTPKVNRRDYTTDGAKVSWSKVSGAAKYRLYYMNNGSWQKIGDYTGTSAELIGFESGYNYKFTVRAINSGGTRFTSGYNSTGYTFKFVDIPKINTGYVTMQRGYYIKWNKPYGAVKFRIFRKTGSGSWKKLADTTADNYHDLNVSYNTRYTYTVRCITSDGKQYVSYYDTKGHSFIYY